MISNGRLFTFGCSFTQYIWPTWADILGDNFSYYENWGQVGAGNTYIYHSVIECLTTQKINPNDTVIIMWSAADREDKYLNGKWINYGPLQHNCTKKLSQQYIKEYYDLKGFLLRDIGLIVGIKNILENQKIPYEFLWMEPIDVTYDENPYLIDVFKEQLGEIYPSMFELIYNNSWYKHSTFSKSVSNKEKYQLLKEMYLTYLGDSWPTFTDFNNNKLDNVPKNILNEITSLGLFKFKDATIRMDNHPEPLWHLEYLTQVLPKYLISQSTVDWIKNFKDGNVFDSHLPKFRI
jgi:hypothetical protein